MKGNRVFINTIGIISVTRVIYQGEGIQRAARYLLTCVIKNIYIPVYAFFFNMHSRIMKKTLIHVIGDSHAKVFQGNWPFIAHHIGAATAYNLVKRHSATNSNAKLLRILQRIKRTDLVILVFGEIDCRIHIYYQFRKNGEKRSINQIIDNTISYYGKTINEIRERGLRPCICSVSPATAIGNEYNVPFYATTVMRSRITRKFNIKLQVFCEKNNYPYIDIYSKVSDENGLMLQEYAADEIHLNSRVIPLVKQEINEKLGLAI